MSTVIEFRAERFKRLRAVEIHPAPEGLVELRGPNAAGKSSIIGGLAAILAGKRANPQDPILHGEGSAEVTATIGDLRIRRRWTDKADPSKSSLIVEGLDGRRYPSPQAVLDGLVAQCADPTEFLGLSDLERSRRLLEFLGIGPELEASRAAERAAETERLIAGREVKRLEGTVQTLHASAGAPVRAEEVDVVLADLRAAQVENEHWGEAQRTLTAATANFTAQKKEKADAEFAFAAAKARVEAAEKAVLAAQAAGRAAKAAADEHQQIDVAPIEGRLVIARAAEKRAGEQERLEGQRQDLTAAMARHTAIQDQIAAIRRARQELLAGRALPAAGFEYDPESERLLLHGVPFAEASSAEQLTASAELAMAQEAKIQVLWCRAGSLLDTEHRRLLGELVAARGWQLWLEVVDENPAGPGIWIEDGTATQSAGPVQPAEAEKPKTPAQAQAQWKTDREKAATKFLTDLQAAYVKCDSHKRFAQLDAILNGEGAKYSEEDLVFVDQAREEARTRLGLP